MIIASIYLDAQIGAFNPTAWALCKWETIFVVVAAVCVYALLTHGYIFYNLNP